jgi:hypothetical protein
MIERRAAELEDKLGRIDRFRSVAQVVEDFEHGHAT